MSIENWTILGVIATIVGTIATVMGLRRKKEKIENKNIPITMTHYVKDSMEESKYGITNNNVEGSISNNVVKNGGINNNTIKGDISNNVINGSINNNKS
jgi:hypothetical protein